MRPERCPSKWLGTELRRSRAFSIHMLTLPMSCRVAFASTPATKTCRWGPGDENATWHRAFCKEKNRKCCSGNATQRRCWLALNPQPRAAHPAIPAGRKGWTFAGVRSGVWPHGRGVLFPGMRICHPCATRLARNSHWQPGIRLRILEIRSRCCSQSPVALWSRRFLNP
jgi:hypothetical protein